MSNPWYNEMQQRQDDQNQRYARLQTEQMNAIMRASGVPTGPNGQPQYQQFTRTQQPGFDSGHVLLSALIGGFIGHLIDLFRMNRYQKKQQQFQGQYQENKAVLREKYIEAYEAWDREYGDAHRQGLPSPPAPTYRSIRDN